MADRQIVVEHEDGRRVGVLESDFDRPEANPFNHGGMLRDDRGGVRLLPARPLDDHQSLKDEGFEPVAYIHGEACDDRCAHGGAVVVHARDEACTDPIHLGPRLAYIPKDGHREHLEDRSITVIHAGNEIAL